MTIKHETISKLQHNLRSYYFSEACPYSRKLICLLLIKNHYVVTGQLLRFYLDRKMRLVKLHYAIRYKSSPYVARYSANNISKRQQLKHDNVIMAFYKLIIYAP